MNRSAFETAGLERVLPGACPLTSLLARPLLTQDIDALAALEVVR